MEERMDGWRALTGEEFYRRALAINAAGNNQASGHGRRENHLHSFQPASRPAVAPRCSLLNPGHAGEVGRYRWTDGTGEYHFGVFCAAHVAAGWEPISADAVMWAPRDRSRGVHGVPGHARGQGEEG